MREGGRKDILHLLLNGLSLENMIRSMEPGLNASGAGEAAAAAAAEERSLSEDLAVVSAWALLAAYGLASNLLILLAIFRNQKLRRSTSYWLIVSLSICDSAMLVICVGQLLPATLFREAYLRLESTPNYVGMFVYDAFWYAGVLHLLFMSLNRYVSICHSSRYYALFSARRTAWGLAATYVAGLVVAVPNLFPCCHLRWDSTHYSAAYEPMDTLYLWVDLSVNGASMSVMLFSYFSIVARVRRSRLIMERYKRLCRESGVTARRPDPPTAARRKSHFPMPRFAVQRDDLPIVSRREIRLFFQFATVSVVFLLSLATWQWLPRVAASKWVGFVVTSLFFINNATNPTVYLVFNSVLRKELRELCCPFRSSADAYHSWAELLQTGGAPFSVVAHHQRRLTQQMEASKLLGATGVTDEDGPAPDVCRNPTMQILLSASLKPSLSPAVMVIPESPVDEPPTPAPIPEEEPCGSGLLGPWTESPCPSPSSLSTGTTMTGTPPTPRPQVHSAVQRAIHHRPPVKPKPVSVYRKRRSWLLVERGGAKKVAPPAPPQRHTNSQHCARSSAACDSCASAALRAQGYAITTPSAHL